MSLSRGRVSEWDLVRADALTSEVRDQIAAEAISDRSVYHYSIPNIEEHGAPVVEDGADIRSAKLRLTGDELLVSRLNPRKGRVLVSQRHDELAVCSGEFVVLRPNEKLDLRFAFYVYSSEYARQHLNSQIRSVTRSHQRAPRDAISKLAIPLPPIEQQVRIADVLDRETGRIDRLITAKKRMIELLEEKRTALISHAVTKGLDPDAPMKDSGIPWLGQVPLHWEILPLRRVATFRNSNVDKKSSADELAVKLCNYTDVYYGDYITSTDGFMTATATPDEVARFKLVRGQVIITKDSESADDIGVPAYVAANLDAVCGYHLTVLEPSEPYLYGEFLYWALESNALSAHFETSCTGVTRFGLGQDAIGTAPIPLPPRTEQRSITGILRETNKTIKSAIARIGDQVELLAEYRQALITAAVTGELDVSGELSNPVQVVAS